MKYDVWHISPAAPNAADTLIGAGFGPLTGYVLAARGCTTAEEADSFMPGLPLRDPFFLRDMDAAVARIRLALDNGEFIAVYGDYDVDGMTSVAVLVSCLRDLGGQVTHYIPDRLEEGYGLNTDALQSLHYKGVRLVVTVDAGVTAIAEAETARAMGLDLIITDHHQCRDILPDACAVVDPCRLDDAYPFPKLAGVGVAFKLVCALCAQCAPAALKTYDALLDRYGDLVALGTVADVMPLVDENRTLVRHGLARLPYTSNVGLRALMEESGLADKRVTTVTLGYILAPRVNAAGRLGKTALAIELLLTKDHARARYLAAELCSLNRYRQTLENEILTEALNMLEKEEAAPALVLASGRWHSGVVGIVASRLAERFAKPVFLICLEEGVGKGSARSGGGVNLVSVLENASDLLEKYGGHEMAAGFSLLEEHIGAFRDRVGAYAARHAASRGESVLTADALLSPALFTHANITGLQSLEPYGMGHPPPVFVLERVALEQVTPVGGGRHLKLSLRAEDLSFQGIFFGMDPLTLDCAEGDLVDIAFHAEINTFLNKSQVQFQLCDMRLASPAREQEAASLALYRRFQAGEALSASELGALRPDRTQLTAVWRYLKRIASNAPMTGRPTVLSRKITRDAGLPLSAGQLLAALDVFEELRLIDRWQSGGEVTLQLAASTGKVELENSEVLRRLNDSKGGRPCPPG